MAIDLKQFSDEIWFDIPNFEGMYKFSNKLRVKSLERLVNAGTGKRLLKEKMCRIFKFPNGYLGVKLHKGKSEHSILIHRMVAKFFISNPENKKVVNHKNGIKDDNSLENLEWVTSSENNLHAIQSGLRKIGYKNPKSKPIIAINKITGEKIIFPTQRNAAYHIGSHQGNVQKALKNEKITANKYYFKYVN
jgi:hypothetical protein